MFVSPMISKCGASHELPHIAAVFPGTEMRLRVRVTVEVRMRAKVAVRSGVGSGIRVSVQVHVKVKIRMTSKCGLLVSLIDLGLELS